MALPGQRIPAAIPANPALAGVQLFTPWGIFGTGANSAGLITSAGLQLTVRWVRCFLEREDASR